LEISSGFLFYPEKRGREKEMSKVVLITGASRGIGRAEAEKFAREGYQVIANYHNSKERMEQFAQQMAEQGLSVIPMQSDVSDEVQVKRMVEEILSQFGHIDVLICNAGIARQGLFTDFTADQWHNMMAVNLDSVFYCCKEVLPSMIRRQKGSIITTSSIWGIAGASCEVPYSASKAAVIGLTKALAKEVGPSGIRVNCIAPGVIDTEMNGNLTAEVMEELKEETPLCQIGTPQQVADCAFFLAEEGASFLTGQVISPNGGFLI
jgi:3-oxoacyl-[acyl-carrier protein] reductase